MGAVEINGLKVADEAAAAFAVAISAIALLTTVTALLNAATRDGAIPAGMIGGTTEEAATTASTGGSGGGATHCTHLIAELCRGRPSGLSGG